MMIPPLGQDFVLDQLQKLHLAFPNNIGMRTNPNGTVTIYREGLHGLSAHALDYAVNRAIQDAKFFPKIAELRESGLAWMRVNQPSFAVASSSHAANELFCPNCRTAAYWRSRWRPLTDRMLRPVVVDGYLLLDPYVRLLCDCAAPSPYIPDSDDPPRMRVSPTAAAPSRTPRELPPEQPDEDRSSHERVSQVAGPLQSTLGDAEGPDW